MSEVLKEAMNRIAARVDALDAESDAVGYVDSKYTRLILSDLDLDIPDVQVQMHELATRVCAGAALDPQKALCCLIADALTQAVGTGVMHERVRVEHERRAGG